MFIAVSANTLTKNNTPPEASSKASCHCIQATKNNIFVKSFVQIILVWIQTLYNKVNTQEFKQIFKGLCQKSSDIFRNKPNGPGARVANFRGEK